MPDIIVRHPGRRRRQDWLAPATVRVVRIGVAFAWCRVSGQTPTNSTRAPGERETRHGCHLRGPLAHGPSNPKLVTNGPFSTRSGARAVSYGRRRPEAQLAAPSEHLSRSPPGSRRSNCRVGNWSIGFTAETLGQVLSKDVLFLKRDVRSLSFRTFLEKRCAEHAGPEAAADPAVRAVMG